jgi:abortive infection bacteriophage resistance protein
VKPSLRWSEQVDLLESRGLDITDRDECIAVLAANNYFRLSGYARYFQRAPHLGENQFLAGSQFDAIRELHDADEQLRTDTLSQLARVEILLRSHAAYVVAHEFGATGAYLTDAFYTDSPSGPSTADICMRDIERSRDRYVLRYRDDGSFAELPIWSAVEAMSFGTLSKCIERGASGMLGGLIATSTGIAKAGFAQRVRSLVYLRNRCAHHSRLWNHSVVDAGPTPNNVRARTKRTVGQFDHRSILDVLASLDDFTTRTRIAEPIVPRIVERHGVGSMFFRGLTRPQDPRDGTTSM